MRLRRAVAIGVGLALALSLIALAVGAARAHRVLAAPYAGWEGEHVDVDIESGLPAGAMVERLAEVGVLRHPGAVRAWLSLTGDGERLQAGEYRFDRPATALEVLDRLRRGDVLLHAVTLPEGLNVNQVAERLAEFGLGQAEGLLAAFRDPAPIRDLDAVATDLEGYLFPDTYRFARHAEPRDIARGMVERFREVTGDGFAERARHAGFDLREVVILASMIEKETSLPQERRRVSRVFHNRLARGMRLECDPTVRYALLREGIAVDRLLYEHLRVDSPWNTYRVLGLPAGPIANPGRASLEAALDPEPGEDLFFVAAPEGGHRFSPNLAQHLDAVADWRRYVKSSR